MIMPDPIDASVWGAIGAFLTAGGVWLRAKLSSRAKERQADADVERSRTIRDERVSPRLMERIEAQDAKIDQYRAELRAQAAEAEARCREELAEQSDRHMTQLDAADARCREKLDALEQHSALLTETLADTRRHLRVLERHPRVLDISEADPEDTKVTRLRDSMREVRRTPTPKPAPLDLPAPKRRDDD